MCAERLPAALHALVPQLAAPQEGVRFAASQALHALVASCLDPGAASASLMRPGRGPSPAQRSMAALEAALEPRYHDALPLALPGRVSCLQAVIAAGLPC